jgi:alanyl-tRNA synthetase
LALGGEARRELAGEDAFKLYDTYGFPLDLTEDICRERGFMVDQAGYDQALAEARRRSEFKGMEQAVEVSTAKRSRGFPAGAVTFSGYERDQVARTVVALIRAGSLVELAALAKPWRSSPSERRSTARLAARSATRACSTRRPDTCASRTRKSRSAA